jgi:hypothetical protein
MPILLLLLTLALPAVAADPDKPAIKIPPYQIPTFSGKENSFKQHGFAPPMQPAMEIDSDLLFRSVVNCFPERVPWGLELDAVAGARYVDQNNSITTFDTSGLAKHYVGVVAKMPLYSAEEINRQRQSEYTRREDVAKNVEAFLSALAAQRRAKRQLGLFTSLEARAQERVALGLADSTEQITYLEKVIDAQSKLDDAEAGLNGARLALVGQCRDEMADSVNNHILQLIGK